MIYPPHKSPNIVKRYWPVIATALADYPTATKVVFDGKRSASTDLARLRDAINALQEYEYEGIPPFPKETLADLKIEIEDGEVWLKARSGQVVGGLELSTLNKPPLEALIALRTLRKHNIINSVSFTTDLDDAVIMVFFNEYEPIKLEGTWYVS